VFPAVENPAPLYPSHVLEARLFECKQRQQKHEKYVQVFFEPI
jgi:hypothetical protein